MRVDLQFVRPVARGFESFDSSDWRLLAKEAAPAPAAGRGRSLVGLDDRPQYAGLVNVQGVFASDDHVAIEHLSGGACRLYLWRDDPEDWDPALFRAQVWEFETPRPNPLQAGFGWDTRQKLTVYGGDAILKWYDRFARGVATSAGEVSVRPWQEFTPPDLDHVLHGIWTPDDVWAEHERRAFARLCGWLGWLPEGAVYAPSGPLHHSRTFLFNAPDTNDSDCTSAQWDFERKMSESGQTSQALSASFLGGVNKICHVFTTEAGDPGVQDWPAASGGDPYRCSMNVTTAGADITYGLLGGGENGGFHRVTSSCGRLETVVQEEAAFSGTGVKVANHTTWDPGTGSDTSQRFQVRIRGSAGSFHGTQNLAITTDASSFAQGPWAGAGGGGSISLDGAVSFAGTVRKKTKDAYTAALTFVGDLVTSGSMGQNVEGSITPAGTLVAVKSALKSIAGVLSFAGVLASLQSSHYTKALAGVVSSAGELTAFAAGTFTQTVSGVVSFVGDLLRGITAGRVLDGAITPTGTLTRQTQKAAEIAGSLGPTGAIKAAAMKRMTGQLLPVGTLTTDPPSSPVAAGARKRRIAAIMAFLRR